MLPYCQFPISIAIIIAYEKTRESADNTIAAAKNNLASANRLNLGLEAEKAQRKQGSPLIVHKCQPESKAESRKNHGHERKGNQRFRCLVCGGKTFAEGKRQADWGYADSMERPPR